MKVTLIGLGNVCGDLTLRAKAALDGASCIIARTALSDSFESLKEYDVRTLDSIFESSRNFDTLNKKLAAEVLNAAKECDVCYCVDGAVSEDEACKIILARHKDCEVLDTVSKGANAYNTARLKAAQHGSPAPAHRRSHARTEAPSHGRTHLWEWATAP